MNRPSRPSIIIGLWILTVPANAETDSRANTARAAIHPVSSMTVMEQWLARVPRTKAFPPDFETTLRAYRHDFVIEMSTSPGCIPCAHLWLGLGHLGMRYGWSVRTIDGQEAMIRSGRMGLPWVGHPVAWVTSVKDRNRIVPIAIGTDHEVNLARNLYLAAKMQSGVRVAVGVRALSKFTGIVGLPQPTTPRIRR